MKKKWLKVGAAIQKLCECFFSFFFSNSIIYYVLFLFFLWMSQQDLLYCITLWRIVNTVETGEATTSTTNPTLFLSLKIAWYTSWPSRLGSGPYTTVGGCTHTVYTHTHTHTHTHLCVCYMYVVCLWEWESERKREYVWRGIRFELPCTFIDCCAHPTRHEDISLNIAAFELYTAQVYSPPQVLCICIL